MAHPFFVRLPAIAAAAALGQARFRTLRLAEALLTGPTGETNAAAWRAPKRVWVHGGDLARSFAALTQLAASGIQTVVLQAAQSVRIDCPQSSFTGALTVGGLLTYQAGMAGSNGAGGSTTINGNITHSGGTLSSNGVVLDTHTHQGVTPGGGNTGEPVR